MQDPISESQNNENESSFWKNNWIDVCEVCIEFLPNLLMGTVRIIAHGLAKNFD
ncbi:hypothetical protein [Acinetobacter sp. ANC 4641]|uniref:hypothetical protein n=1 Tax=Acinetobacter sp. ANC 4641 TaxID=2529847 RepID=UPI0013F160CC|nr:hypothetical protein [Acinetobacter sp. ANC 4641]